MTINQTRQRADQSLQWDRANREIQNAMRSSYFFHTLHLKQISRFRISQLALCLLMSDWIW